MKKTDGNMRQFVKPSTTVVGSRETKGRGIINRRNRGTPQTTGASLLKSDTFGNSLYFGGLF